MPSTIKVNGLHRTVGVGGKTPLFWVMHAVPAVTGTNSTARWREPVLRAASKLGTDRTTSVALSCAAKPWLTHRCLTLALNRRL